MQKGRRQWGILGLLLGAVMTCVWPVMLGLIFVQTISVPAYPGEPLPAWVSFLDDIKWGWLIVGLLLLISGGAAIRKR